MPYISTKVNVEIDKAAELKLKTRFGKAIELLPGKSEAWLMLSFEDNCRLWFKGSDEKSIAFVEVKIFGKANSESYNRLTAELTKILQEELGIAPGCVYVKYEEINNWGYNGSNF